MLKISGIFIYLKLFKNTSLEVNQNQKNSKINKNKSHIKQGQRAMHSLDFLNQVIYIT
jgi:hypothetical protein